jgi:hypothetical protein
MGPGGDGEGGCGMSALPVFEVWETKLMGRLGVRDRDVIREVRARVLVENVDWALIKGRVCLTELAVQKMAGALMPEKKPGPIGPIAEAWRLLPERAESGAAQVLSVVRQARNRQVLVCAPEGYERRPEAWVNVRVADNVHFVPGTKTGRILARPVERGAWEFCGNPDGKTGRPRCPRFRGGW